MKKYQVRMNNDGVGYFVVEVIAGLGDMYIKGTSLSRREMIDLANRLNAEVTQ